MLGKPKALAKSPPLLLIMLTKVARAVRIHGHHLGGFMGELNTEYLLSEPENV